MVSNLVNELRQHTAGADFQRLMDQAASAIERQAKISATAATSFVSGAEHIRNGTSTRVAKCGL